MAESRYTPLSSKDLLTIAQLSRDELDLLFATAGEIKGDPLGHSRALAGLSVVLIFEKPSLRTRVSFEVGVHRLGGQAIFYDCSAEHVGARESVKDYARNLERWVHGIVARTYSQETLEGLAAHSRVPIINALSNTHHPCQALADLFTLNEQFGTLEGVRLAYVGDGNNVCHSLIQCATKLGVDVTVVGPQQYWPDPAVVSLCKKFAKSSGGSITLSENVSAVKGHDAIYTDAWVSMHQTDGAARTAALAAYQVNEALMDRASSHCVFMHCLPAHRGEEVTNAVMDSPESMVYQQAENRMHVQNAVLLHTIGARRNELLKPFPTHAGGDARDGRLAVAKRARRAAR